MSNNVKKFIFENTRKPISDGYSALILCTVQCDSWQKPDTLPPISAFQVSIVVAQAAPSSTARMVKRVPEGTRASPICSERDGGFEPVTWEISSNTVSVAQQYNSLSITSAFTLQRRKLTPHSIWSEPFCILFACVFFPCYSMSRISMVLAQTLARISLDDLSQCNFCFTVQDWSFRVALSERLCSCSSSCGSRALC